MTEHSIAMNGLSKRICILCGDLRGGTTGVSGSFNAVSCNPPYMALGRGEHSRAPSHVIARQGPCCTLEEVVKGTVRFLKDGGRAYLVYRPGRPDELLTACAHRGLMPKRMKFARPFPDRETNLVLPEAVKDSGHFLRVEVPIIMFRAPGVYTNEIREIYGY